MAHRGKKLTPPGDRQSYISRMRERKQKKLYSEDWAVGEEEIEGLRTFNLQEKLEDPAFASHNIVKEMHGSELNVAYFQRHGFSTPLLFKEKTGLGLRVPTSNFTINDVRMCVGSRRVLDVMDVNTQKNSEMTMKEWQKYYEEPEKDKLLNVISLEFSHTKLENYVQSPTVVRQIDWVDCVWPRHLKESQVEATNVLEEMKYPKVQKYCLMSVKGCYTDFHVDFGGTSVWYHILKGGKVFWLIPPTEHNLGLYERWVLSGKQSDIFFGDTVEKCARIVLHEGNTFFIPTGWIHAVYTPMDSLVFGGNFLHSYGIDQQLKIAQVEDTTKVPQKFRYPFFTEMLWYVLERYVHCLLGNSHLTTGQDAPIPPDRPHIHLTQAELHGLKEIVLYLHMLPSHKKNVPDLLKDPISLIQDVRTLIGLHRQDNRDLAVTDRPILAVPDDEKGKIPSPRGPYNKGSMQKPPRPPFKGPKVAGEKGGPRRRRTRCKKCEACQRSDCGECSFCLDMVKFGGPGRAKQTCNMRQCLQPMLPVTAACSHCGLDGWMQTPVTPLQKGPQRCESASNLMECSVCYEIAHPQCVQRLCTEFTGFINEDMPNSWECPMCCKLGKNTDYRPRHFRARQKSSDIRRMSISSDASSAIDNKTNQEQMSDSGSDTEHKDIKELLPIKKRRSSEGAEIETKNLSPGDPPRKTAFRMQLAHQIVNNSTKVLKKPMVVVRPASIVSTPVSTTNLAMDKRCMLLVFRYMSPKELLTCALVCKTWATFTVAPCLWRKMSFNRKHISSDILKGIVRRQPECLCLDWCHINKFQLPWLIQRLGQLKELSLVSINVKTAISLKSNHSAVLVALDISFISDFNDSALRDIIGPNSDSRTSLPSEKIRFRNLKDLKLAGTDITDIAMRYVTQYLPKLQHLSLGMCPRISDAGIAQLSTKPANTVTNLVSLDLSHSKLVTETSLEHLSKCENLVRLDCRHSLQISTQALIKFAAKSDKNLQVREIKLVDVRQK
ncbi:jmjC domain-containing histone demethylation protein 1-like [Diabrotica virgifera virgifera]|uniref:[histone H3]-dimethyl-L-lysine(36) demethylase n=1 Tax=Diabrotica virgifera virgifera TaxID=50390 RepID=A0A6P7G514_DIAVI|nr:jmjC domain-containing histone demethylation protein 1-like [Diabrotica virgifera virgifera]XP_050499643.1 jmjC domain-containing histone demethylation protein 1-like [Diabrotica virgifera virgifera]